MRKSKLGILAALLLLAACGGPTDTGAGDPTAGDEPATAPTIPDSELVTSDPAVPTIGRFQLGVHFARLSPTQPTSSSPDKVEVAEVFWYGCPHCFAFDPLLDQWRGAQPDYVSFVRVPAVWNPLLQLHARAFYTAEALGQGARLHGEFFREIHERRNMLDSEAKLAEFFGRFGVGAAAFKTAFDSFEVHAKLQRADELSRRYRIESVPTLVVNGKYTTGGGQIGSYEELLELADALVAAEHEGR